MKSIDFGEGKISSHILRLAIPIAIAQIAGLLYNVIDRIYIGHLQETLTLTALGVCFPFAMLTQAFANLFGMGGLPLFSIARGKQDEDSCFEILTHSFLLISICAICLMVLFYLGMVPLLKLFGASQKTLPIAKEYIRIYLSGTYFSMIVTGLNGYINAQGFAKVGMVSIILGAGLNLILDPIFIFTFHLGVVGAAIATVLSQVVSSIYVLYFLLSHQFEYYIKFKNFRLKKQRVLDITYCGMSGFIMQATNSFVQINYNIQLHFYGNDMFIGIMTILNSIESMVMLPMHSIATASGPVLSYNFGAKKIERVEKCLNFTLFLSLVVGIAIWLVIMLCPQVLLQPFTSDKTMIQWSIKAARIYFAFLFAMSFQICGQQVFTSLKKPKFAVFFSLLRKVVFVVPLSILIPKITNYGVWGVFMADPISQITTTLVCYFTMRIVVKKELIKIYRN